MKTAKWYSTEEGKYVIELKVDNLEQLFDKKDPNPYRKKDLDDDAAEYIISSASEIGLKNIGKIKIFTYDNTSNQVHKTIQKAISEYFFYRADIKRKNIRTTFYLGFKTLIIGLSFLSLVIFITSLLDDLIKSSLLKSFIKEGLLLIGWVSMWKPINIFLYEWWPQITAKNLYENLSLVNVEIIYREKEARKKLFDKNENDT